MSTLIQQPDAISFSWNMKKFIVSSAGNVSFQLRKGATLVLDELYTPGEDDLLQIDMRSVIDNLLSVTIPDQTELVTEQVDSSAVFIALIDGNSVSFLAIKGGVAELQETTAAFTENHFLSWQLQDKKVLQYAPEWLTFFAASERVIKVRAYFQDNTSETISLASVTGNKVWLVNTSWSAINNALTKKNPVIWDVWLEDLANIRLTYIQRYTLRNAGASENIFLWANSLGGIDSVSFKGYQDQDQKIEHQMAEYADKALIEFDSDPSREINQATGYLAPDESRWLIDFFLSSQRYYLRSDGTIKSIVLVASKVVDSTIDDLHNYEFTFRYGEDTRLLNLDRTSDPLPAPEGLDVFFLNELLSALPVANYNSNLLLAVQSPFAPGWMQLPVRQLLAGALPELIDGTTITIQDGKLKAMAGALALTDELKAYLDSLKNNGTPNNDTASKLLSGAVLWKSGLSWQSTDLDYKILGVNYTAKACKVTLQDADPNLSRIDLFYVDVFSNLQVATGIPSVNPATPILGAMQLEIMSVLIAPGALQPGNVDIEKVYDENNPGSEWTATAFHDENITVDLNSTDQPFNGGKRVKIVLAIPDTQISYPLHYIGEEYQGGRIFWLKPESNGREGLIAAKDDVAQDRWSWISGYSSYGTGAYGKEIGTGQENTVKILAKPAAADCAVKYCTDFVADDFDDWFFPAEKEVQAMQTRRFDIGGLGNKTYWSSTEHAWDEAVCITMSNGAAYARSKRNQYSIRPIRAFNDNLLPTNLPTEYYTPTDTSLVFSAPADIAVNGGILSMNLKSSLPWRYNSILLIESYLGAVRTGSVAISPSSNLFGYKPEDNSWQMVALQIASLNPNRETLNAFKISVAGSWPNTIELGFDDIRFQHSEIVTESGSVAEINDYHLVEQPDGARTVFSTARPYKPGTTQLFINGIRQFKGTDADYTETDGKIVLSIAPDPDDDLICSYNTL